MAEGATGGSDQGDGTGRGSAERARVGWGERVGGMGGYCELLDQINDLQKAAHTSCPIYIYIL